MKDLNNIVVYNEKNPLIGSEIINVFKEFGIDTDAEGCSIWFPYYGMIDNHFSCYSYNKVKCSNAKIINLEQLKSMKEDKSEYPKLMYVGDSLIGLEHNSQFRDSLVVVMHYNNQYWACPSGYTLEDYKQASVLTGFQYAQDIEEEKPEVDPIKITIPFEIVENSIIILNGVEYVPKNNQ